MTSCTKTEHTNRNPINQEETIERSSLRKTPHSQQETKIMPYKSRERTKWKRKPNRIGKGMIPFASRDWRGGGAKEQWIGFLFEEGNWEREREISLGTVNSSGSGMARRSAALHHCVSGVGHIREDYRNSPRKRILGLFYSSACRRSGRCSTPRFPGDWVWGPPPRRQPRYCYHPDERAQILCDH